MTDTSTRLTDTEFLQQFTQQTLAPAEFSHIGHIRLAWLYLHANTLGVAVAKTCTGIRAFAEKLGAPDKFHYTLTAAMVSILAERANRQPSISWNAFIALNQDLVTDAKSVIHTYYSEDLLNSNAARKQYCPPDLRPFGV